MNTIDSAVNAVLAAKQGAVSAQIQTAVMSKSLQSTRQQGEAVVNMLAQNAAQSKEHGKGSQFDRTA